MIIYKLLKTLGRIERWFNRINVGKIIAYHCRGYVKARIESWYYGKQIIYFEGELTKLRELKWKIRKKLYKERVYNVDAENNTLIIQLWKEKPKLEKFIKEKLEAL